MELITPVGGGVGENNEIIKKTNKANPKTTKPDDQSNMTLSKSKAKQLKKYKQSWVLEETNVLSY